MPVISGPFFEEIELVSPLSLPLVPPLHHSKRYVMQANNSDDRKAWLEVMEGKEPVYTSLKVLEGTHLDLFPSLHLVAL